MDDDNYDITSLPSSISMESSYTPKSAGDSPFDFSPSGDTPAFPFPPPSPKKEAEDDFDLEEQVVSPKEKFEWINVDNPKWINVLLSNNFYIKDCAPDGNCQFRSLEEALRVDPTLKMTHKQLRQSVAKHILSLSDLEFKDIIDTYRAEKDSGEFYGAWDPHSVKTKRQFAIELKKPGFHFEGDNLTLSLLSKILNIDIIILNEIDYSITHIENNNTKFIVIHFTRMGNTGHYKTIGYKMDNKISTLFDKTNLPEEVIPLIDKRVFYKKQLQRIYKTEDTFTCNNVLFELQNLLGKLRVSDKKLICILAAEMINKEGITPKKKAPKRKSKAPKSKASSKKSKSKSKSSSEKSKRKSKKSKSKRKSKSKKSKSKRKSKGKKSKSKRKSVKKSKS